jgi:hypothetical protein
MQQPVPDFNRPETSMEAENETTGFAPVCAIPKAGHTDRRKAQPWSFRTSRRAAAPRLKVETVLCIPDDQRPHLPDHRPAPDLLPPGSPIPRFGEFVYLSSTSAWVVRRVVHEWLSPTGLRIEIWLDWVGSSRQARNPDFMVTQ